MTGSSASNLASTLHSAGVREDILAALREADGGLRKKTIVTVAQTSRTSAHRHLNALREMGKIERYRDEDDRRVVRYRPAGSDRE